MVTRKPTPPTAVPFRSVDEAWFWTMAALVARREASPRGCDGVGPPRPAMPEDILRYLTSLHRQNRIRLEHVRIMRVWGERGVSPDPTRPAQLGDFRLWREALDRLDSPLRLCGIVASDQARLDTG